MSHTKDWRRDRSLVRASDVAEALESSSEAELYLFLGRLLRTRMGRGFPIQEDAHAIRLPVSECMAAVIYAGSSGSLKLRALVEGWSWRMIKQQVARVRVSNERTNCDPPFRPTSSAK